jgi:FkbM family methyltransferase
MNINHPEQFIPTDTLKNHVLYTRVEFINSPYYMSVLKFLFDKKIESMVDLGGCTGETTLIYKEGIPTLKKCLILEPILENFNFIINRVDEQQVTVLQKAIYYGSSYLEIGLEGRGVGSWSHDFNKNVTKCETITLEEIESNMLEIDFIKVDIEGLETNLIENSKALQNIKYLEIEFHRDLIMSTKWSLYVEKWLPNHKLLYGGSDGKNQDGSGFFVRKDIV